MDSCRQDKLISSVWEEQGGKSAEGEDRKKQEEEDRAGLFLCVCMCVCLCEVVSIEQTASDPSKDYSATPHVLQIL